MAVVIPTVLALALSSTEHLLVRLRKRIFANNLVEDYKLREMLKEKY